MVVPQVQQVKAGEVPKVSAVDPLNYVPTEIQLAAIERPRHELGHIQEAILFAVDSQAKVCDV